MKIPKTSQARTVDERLIDQEVAGCLRAERRMAAIAAVAAAKAARAKAQRKRRKAA